MQRVWGVTGRLSIVFFEGKRVMVRSFVIRLRNCVYMTQKGANKSMARGDMNIDK
jgi:hypothetical protein